MSNNKCKYPKCNCKVETFTCDNSIDFSNPMFVGSDYEITTYKKIVCKHKIKTL